jgi:hypothetical protein
MLNRSRDSAPAGMPAGTPPESTSGMGVWKSLDTRARANGTQVTLYSTQDTEGMVCPVIHLRKVARKTGSAWIRILFVRLRKKTQTSGVGKKKKKETYVHGKKYYISFHRRRLMSCGLPEV